MVMHAVHAHPEVGVTARPSVLELGADVGAAVIYMTEAYDGAEIEIKPRCGEWNGAHTAVRRRVGAPGSAPQFAALFYGLAEGTYDLRLHRDLRSLHVFGGQVTEVTWLSASLGQRVGA